MAVDAIYDLSRRVLKDEYLAYKEFIYHIICIWNAAFLRNAVRKKKKFKAFDVN